MTAIHDLMVMEILYGNDHRQNAQNAQEHQLRLSTRSKFRRVGFPFVPGDKPAKQNRHH
jgi:hypothetical protein